MGAAPGHAGLLREVTSLGTLDPVVPMQSLPIAQLARGLADDEARTRAARRLVPTGRHDALDRLAGLAARLLSSPSAQVSLLTDSQQLAASVGVEDAGPVGLERTLCTVTATGAGPLVVTDASADPRVADLPPVAGGGVGSYLGVPLVSTGGQTVGALCVFDDAPHTWTAYDVALLEQLGESVMAELELAALSTEYESSRERWDTALEAAGIGGFDWHLGSERIEWDPRMQELFGYRPGEYDEGVTQAFSRIHADDRPAIDDAIAVAVASCGDYRAEFRVWRPDGSLRWVSARGRAVAGPDGVAVRLLGTAHDVTEVRTASERAAHVLETMAMGFVALDHEWRVTYLNAKGSRVVGFPAEELVGHVMWDLFPGLRDSTFGQAYEQAVRTGEPVEFEAWYEHLGKWFEVHAVPGPDGLHLYFVDISARREDQQLAALASTRLELLAMVSTELSATLETEAAVSRLARLVVPALGDWAVITLVRDDGSLSDVGSWHADPDCRAAVERYTELRLAALTGASFVAEALRTGREVLVESAAAEQIHLMLAPGEAQDLVRRLAPESAAFLPLRARGRTVGLLSLFRGASRVALSAGDLSTALAVTARAGLALENARLFAQQRSLAEGLQRSLLTAPPEPDHCEIVVRYSPAAEIASVGGDWFDSFLQSDGATVLVIGDVVGHDTEAAAAMGQVRGLLRGIAWHSGSGPAEVLRGLDAAMQGLLLETTATAVVGRLEQTQDELDRGVTRLRWSNAGHPPPMVVLPDGGVMVLSGLEADLLLGIDAHTPRVEEQVALDRGSTVLLYTDGLVERRGQSLDEGLALLRATLTELAELPLAELCDELLVRMLPDQAEDDVALVAVRLHRQDRPRPVEAGPTLVPPEVPDDEAPQPGRS